MSSLFDERKTPTLYFIGVTTGKSSIMRVFPRWAEALGLDAEIVGVDCALHDRPERYRAIVEWIKSDPLSLGALVTTHKLDLLEAARDLFDELGAYASRLGEVSCIAKRDGRLIGKALDPITSGLSLSTLVPEAHWASGAQALILGAGGSSLALSVNLVERAAHKRPHPERLVVANRSQRRLDEMRKIHGDLASDLDIAYVLAPSPTDSDRLCSELPPGSLVINATGLGKDRPGSPLTWDASFPRSGYAWDFNYRGELVFLDQARAQQQDRGLRVGDGWTYFVHGWTRVISEVFNVEIPVAGPRFDELSRIALRARTAPQGG